MFASTKFVRNVVRSIVEVDNVSWSDKCKSKKQNVENLRNITFRVFENDAKLASVKANLELALFVAGYKNKVKVTTSKYCASVRAGGYTYLRINKCVLD